jgi:digeranylgeranylglycerophospholipid reductase
MSRQICDVLIAGAGPVGSYLAWLLSTHGLKVMMLDRKKDPGDKVCCTGIISRECLRQLAVNNTVISSDLHNVNLFSPSGRTVSFKRKKAIAHVVDRPALNRVLVARASGSGVLSLLDTDIRDIIQKDDCVEIEATSGKLDMLFKAKMVVIASGYGTGLVKKCGLEDIRNYIIGCQSEVELSSGGGDTDIYLDHKLAPHGFAWLVPTQRNKALAGMLVSRNPRQNQRKFIDKLSTAGKISYYEAPAFGLIPLSPLKRTYNDRIVVVGEAAGQVKPTTGGGLYYGVLAAYTAAETIKQAFAKGDFSAVQLSSYEKGWQKLLQHELKLGHYLQKFYATLGNRMIDDIVMVMQRRNITGSADSPDLSFDWHSKAVSQLLREILSSHKNK